MSISLHRILMLLLVLTLLVLYIACDFAGGEPEPPPPERGLADDGGARSQRGYLKAVETAQRDIELLRDFHRMFPGGIASISGFSRADREPKAYTGIATVHGRYELFVQLPIMTDRGRVQEIAGARAVMFVREIIDVNRRDDGRLDIGYGEYWPIDEAAWDKLCRQEGRVELVLEGIKMNQPVEGFEMYEAWLKQGMFE